MFKTLSVSLFDSRNGYQKPVALVIYRTPIGQKCDTDFATFESETWSAPKFVAFQQM